MKLVLKIILLIFGAQLVFAKDVPISLPFYDIASLDAKIQIDQKGDVDVTKTFVLSSPSLDFSWSEDLPVSNLEILAGDSLLNKKDYELTKEKGKIFIKAQTERSTQSWTIRFKAPESLKPSKTQPISDNFFLGLLSEPGVYIRELSATLTLPDLSLKPEDIKQKVYAVHGVGSANYNLLNSQTLVYMGSDLSPFSTYSIEASWPAGFIKYPTSKKIYFYIRALDFRFWLTVGIVLPFFAFLFFFLMLYKKRKEERIIPLKYLDKPPEDLPPALVGVLFREQASQREITATILDLAQHGFIDIVKKREEYVLGKRKGEGVLSPIEAFLYDKLFTQQGERKIKRTEFELEKRASEQLYSPKISQFYQDLYKQIQKRNYFVKNPVLVALRYRIFGIIFFLLAILASFLTARYSEGPPYVLFGFLGQIIASFLIIKTAPLMSKRTPEGREALSQWFAFRQFLSDKKTLSLSASQQGLFEKYLPYAVALGKELDWTARFSGIVYTVPSWYVAEETPTLESFAASLFYITGSLSQVLYGLREPGL